MYMVISVRLCFYLDFLSFPIANINSLLTVYSVIGVLATYHMTLVGSNFEVVASISADVNVQALPDFGFSIPFVVE
jgi:hypothetical protein